MGQTEPEAHASAELVRAVGSHWPYLTEGGIPSQCCRSAFSEESGEKQDLGI